MYAIDERLRGLPAVKDQVVQLYQSLNTPHLAIPNKRAGPATAFVLGLRGPSGFAVFVYLYMHESGECAVYVPSSGTVPAELFQNEEAEALGFVESMGFIMDNLNFRGRPPEEQDAMIRGLPVFMREPPAPAPRAHAGAPAGKKPSGASSSVVQLGKLFSAFCLALLVQGCAHVGDQEREQSRLHFEMAADNLTKSPQIALQEAEQAIAIDPENADAWHVKAIVLHNGFHRLEEAHQAFMKAIALRPQFPQAHNNLGNLYMDEKRFDDAIAEYQKALDDVTYQEPSYAQGNMGWAYFRKGDVPRALELLKSSVSINQNYCLGYVQLGSIYEGQGSLEESCKYYGRFREHCPERPDAWQHEGVCLANAGNGAEAAKAFDQCVTKSTNDDQKDLCRQLKERLGQ